MTIYIARTPRATVVSRETVRLPAVVPHRWRGVVETVAPAAPPAGAVPPVDVAMVVLPALVVAAVSAVFLAVPIALLMGGLAAVVLALLSLLRRRRAAKNHDLSGKRGARELTASAEREAFDRFLGLADRISETWPALAGLVDVPAASAMLTSALWEVSGVLARRQELTAVLAELSRPDFAVTSPADRTASELQSRLRATKLALSDIEIDLAAREASLRRAEEAGRAFIREQEMRQAIRAAEQSLHPDGTPPVQPDPGAELAEQTDLVVIAYRELIEGPGPHRSR